jgi:outer membrane protein W
MNSLKVLALATLAIALVPAAFAHDPNVWEPGVKVVSTSQDPYLDTPHASGRVSLVYVSPTGDGSFLDTTVEADSAWGGSLGWEWRCGHWVGIDLNAIYAKHDIDLAGYGKIGETTFLPVTLGLNVHVTPEKSPVDVFVGALFGYAMYDNLETHVDGYSLKADVDSDMVYGFNLGIEVPAPKRGWAFYAAVKYLITEYSGKVTIDGSSGGDLGVDIDPWIGQVGLAYRY